MTNELEFQPQSPEVLRDPYPYYEWMRETAPVYHVPNSDIWAITRYADVEASLRNHAVFSSTGGVGPEWNQRPMMSMYDPPEHTRLRRIVARHFTPKYLGTLAPSMEATTTRLVDQLLENGGGDLVTDFAEPIVATVLADILGIPEERRGDFRRWSHSTVSALAAGETPGKETDSEKTRIEFVTYLKEIVQTRREAAAAYTGEPRPARDIIEMLVSAGENEVLTPREITAFCVLLLVAGFETTVNGLCNTAHVVMTQAGVWSAVQQDRSLLSSMVEEALRFEAPVQAFFRNTLTTTSVAGVTIPERQKVMMLFGSANRDPRKYANPATYDLRRNPTDHLSFGHGVHQCLGTPLARLLYGIVWRALFQRLSVMEPSGEPVRINSALLRGFRTLPVAARAL